MTTKSILSTDTEFDPRWVSLGIVQEYLESKAVWLRERRQLHHTSVDFFELASKLLLYSRFDYPLASLAFFQAVIGLERALRVHYRSETEGFRNMLGNALSEGIVTDALFPSARPIPKELLKRYGVEGSTHSEKLAVLIPKLRNDFVHGTYLISPVYLDLTFQLREIADALSLTKSTGNTGAFQTEAMP